MRTRVIAAVGAAVAALAVPALASPKTADKWPGDTGVVTVSSEAHVSEGEEPLAVNPGNPNELTAVANVFQPLTTGPASMYVGGSGVQDSRLYVSRDGGRHWRALKLDVGGVGPVVFPSPTGAIAPEFSDAGNVLNT